MTEQMTQHQFWNYLQFLIDEKGWSIREEDDGSIRLAQPRRRAHYDFCPLTAVHFDCMGVHLDIMGGEPMLTSQFDQAAKSLGIGPRIMAKIVKLADEEDSYPNFRPAWLASLGLRTA